jgi:hypothetical protein
MTAKRVFGIAGGILGAGLLLFLFIVNFSAVESRYECAGELTTADAKRKATAFLHLEEYRWWVGLWSDSDAALWVEVPNETVEYFSYIVRAGDQMQIFENPTVLEGTFSTLSRRFALKTHAGFFDGSCKRMAAVDA